MKSSQYDKFEKLHFKYTNREHKNKMIANFQLLSQCEYVKQ